MKLCLLFIFSFFLSSCIYFFQVKNNTVSFSPDEFYWISTGRIVPLVMAGNWEDPFWNEYYGYANFNGAKWICGTGFFLLGMNDFSQFGYPPQTYYKYKDEHQEFPQDKNEYAYLFWGRMIALTSVAFSVGLLSLASYTLGKNFYVAAFVGFLYAIHPLVQEVALHAYADGFFLLMCILLVFLNEYIVRTTSRRTLFMVYALWGIIFSWMVSLKINAIIFGILLITTGIRRYYLRVFTREEWKNYVVALVFVGMFFVILHPNFVMVSLTTPVELLSGRMQITKEHMAYFGQITPSHVLWNMPQRLDVSFQFLFFSNWILLLGFLLLVALLWYRKLLFYTSATWQMLYSGGFVWISCLVYVVFREGRYFLPVIPFLILFIVHGTLDLFRNVVQTEL